MLRTTEENASCTMFCASGATIIKQCWFHFIGDNLEWGRFIDYLKSTYRMLAFCLLPEHSQICSDQAVDELCCDPWCAGTLPKEVILSVSQTSIVLKVHGLGPLSIFASVSVEIGLAGQTQLARTSV